MKIEKFLVAEKSKLKLGDHPTDYTGDYTDKHDGVKDLHDNIKELSEMQELFWADNRHALLLIFQAMDAAGKDSTIEHVMSGLNPQGVSVTSFKQPSSEELDHDYLWRCAKNLPERGKIGIFNRSYYEDVLIVRVHPEILQFSQLPEKIKNDKNIWQKRFAQIKNFETYLAENGIHVLKFFLHVSKEEQKNRFLKRINTPEKNWKFSATDAKERAFWDDYMQVYTEAMQATSTEAAPWFVIPADHKWFMRVAVSNIIVEKLKSLDLNFPQLNEEHRQNLLEAKKVLESES